MRRKDARARRGGKYEKVGGDGMGAHRKQDDVEVCTQWEPRREPRQAFTYFPTLLTHSFTKERAQEDNAVVKTKRNETRDGGGKEKDASMYTALTLRQILCLGLEAHDLIDSEQPSKL